MPLFDFTCRKCGRTFEALVPRAGVKPTCPACKSSLVVKKLSVFSASMGKKEQSEPACATGGCSSGACPSGGSCPYS